MLQVVIVFRILTGICSVIYHRKLCKMFLYKPTCLQRKIPINYGVQQQQKRPIRLQNKQSTVAWFTITNPAPPQPPIRWLLTVKYYQAGIVTEATLQLDGQALFR